MLDFTNGRRKVRIGVLNVMPEAEKYMPVLEAIMPKNRCCLRWIRIANHPYRSSDRETIAKTHVDFFTAMKEGLDAIFLTGAPVDTIALATVYYWEEVSSYLDLAYERGLSIFGICWGALAVGQHFFGLPVNNFHQKLYGVFKMKNLVVDHPAFVGLDDDFACPQSRFAGFEDKAVIDAQKSGKLLALDYNSKTGFSSVVSSDLRIWMVQGHPEYPTDRLAKEYYRNQKRDSSTQKPINYNVLFPTNVWQTNGKILFNCWIKSIERLINFPLHLIIDLNLSKG